VAQGSDFRVIVFTFLPIAARPVVAGDAPASIVIDATYEALSVILVNNPNGVLAHRDELVVLLKSFDREDGQQARGFFLSAWSGKEPYATDRIIRGAAYIEAPCVGLLGTTQPGKIGPYIGRAVDGGEGDDGMIQRFSMAVWPDQLPDWQEVDRYVASAGPMRRAELVVTTPFAKASTTMALAAKRAPERRRRSNCPLSRKSSTRPPMTSIIINDDVALHICKITDPCKQYQ
jgi:hypothetical protein